MTRLTPTKAIRAKCSECAGSPRAATRCEKEDCPSYPYRTGRNPARTGIGRSNLHKDAHSGKFRPTQDGCFEQEISRQGVGRGKSGSPVLGQPRGISSPSSVDAYRDPFSSRAEEIARQAILRADSLGMEHYGPAPAPLEEKRDMYQEAIEELLDAIYYLTRQVARLEDLREKLRGEERT
ncbi:MAG: hypothetical protein ACYC37_01930 [Desulfobacteria bacterium]